MSQGDAATPSPRGSLERRGTLQQADQAQPAAGLRDPFSATPGRPCAHARSNAGPGVDPGSAKGSAPWSSRERQDRGLHGRGRGRAGGGAPSLDPGAGDIADAAARGTLLEAPGRSSGDTAQPADRAGARSAVVARSARRGGPGDRQPLGGVRPGSATGPDLRRRGGVQRLQAGPDAAL